MADLRGSRSLIAYAENTGEDGDRSVTLSKEIGCATYTFISKAERSIAKETARRN